jgi:hypothetical protein
MEFSDAVIGAIHDPIRETVNWGLLVCVVGCLCVWGAVVFGIVAAV